MTKQNYRDLTKALLEARDGRKSGLVWERDAIEANRILKKTSWCSTPCQNFMPAASPSRT